MSLVPHNEANEEEEVVYVQPVEDYELWEGFIERPIRVDPK